jgi:ABC-2 type transport system permease protein
MRIQRVSSSMAVIETQRLTNIGSSRAKDAKGAESPAVIVVLPVLALIGVQITGIVWFMPLLTFALAAGIAVADAITLFLAVRLFQRETVVTRWR